MFGKSLLRVAAVWLTAFHILVSPGFAMDAGDSHFRSPVAAVDALLEALRADDMDSLSAIFGPESGDVLSSGDDVADQNIRRVFLEYADLRTRLDREPGDRVILSIGADDWPFPIPLLKGESGWYFDTATGVEEIVNRRIGRNELHAIAAVNAFVGAQYEYYAQAPTGEGLRQYAQRISSREGMKDGLYWPAAQGEAESPLGPLVAKAERQGYGGNPSGQESTEPFYGYLFKILSAQGPNAPGGERSYLVNGAMAGGFAVLAYPVEHGNSGIMTFIVNQRGIIYQKDLGPDTGKIVESIEAFDPDASWDPVPL